jgi:exonuclease VII large subunit
MIGFLICFILIYYFESNYIPRLIKIENISNLDLNKHIRIQGEIVSQRVSSNTLFLKIKDSSINKSNNIIDAILFKTNKTLDKTHKFIFEGKVGTYQNKYQLIISNIYST